MAKAIEKAPIKYVKVMMGSPMDDRKHISDRVMKGELKLSYFAIDNEKFYHYYEIIK